MKLYNVIVVHDVFVLGENEDDAREAVFAAINEGEKPSEHTAIAVTHERAVRSAWLEQKPFVGALVSESDFESVKGKTTIEICKMLIEKPAKVAAKK